MRVEFSIGVHHDIFPSPETSGFDVIPKCFHLFEE